MARVLASLLLWFTCAGFAQPAHDLPAFEVATIKPSQQADLLGIWGNSFPMTMRGGPGTPSPGEITFKNASLRRYSHGGVQHEAVPDFRTKLDCDHWLPTLSRKGPLWRNEGPDETDAAASPCRAVPTGRSPLGNQRPSCLRAGGCERRPCKLTAAQHPEDGGGLIRGMEGQRTRCVYQSDDTRLGRILDAADGSPDSRFDRSNRHIRLHLVLGSRNIRCDLLHGLPVQKANLPNPLPPSSKPCKINLVSN